VTSPVLASVRDRLVRLADTLGHLKVRVREAVATELGRAVADAVRDLLTAVLRSRPVVDEDADERRSRQGPTDPRADRRPPRDPWADDDPDPWAGDDPREDPDEHRHQPEPSTTSPPRSASWASAVSVGAVLARWLLTRRLTLWPCVGVGVALGAAALAGGPAVRAVLAAVATAADLVSLTQSPPD
jgi:hypothetical protein